MVETSSVTTFYVTPTSLVGTKGIRNFFFKRAYKLVSNGLRKNLPVVLVPQRIVESYILASIVLVGVVVTKTTKYKALAISVKEKFEEAKKQFP